MIEAPRILLRSLFNAAVASAQPEVCLPPHLPPLPSGHTIVVGAGKASASMAATVTNHWPAPVSGLVISRHGQSAEVPGIDVAEAGHPTPDAAGEAASRQLLNMVSGLSNDDLVLALISGGGSALMTLPPDGLTLSDLQYLNDALLASGAAIGDINCVRKHLSAINGGRLAKAAHPARLHALVISDVVGDDPSNIASGPTVGDPATSSDALDVLNRYGIVPSTAIAAYLQTPESESIKPGDPCLATSQLEIVASGAMALDAAATAATEIGLQVINLGDRIEGEARDVASAHADLVRTARPGTLVLSGGELTVTLSPNSGKGGPNTEYALALAIALDGHPGVYALAADTDGIDGSGDNAGAYVDADTLTRAASIGLNPAAMLAENRSYDFFDGLDELLVCGPTNTNVNDFRAILITG